MGSTVQHGDTVKDVITGFAGRVTARCEYMRGTTQVLVESDTAARWFEEPRLEVIATMPMA